MNDFSVGWEEWASLPELGLPALKIKTDTGAKTSALHAFNIQPFGTKSKPKVRFGIHPIPDQPDVTIYCSAPVIGRRNVTSSNGQTELRYVIETPITIGERTWNIEVTLTNREGMAYRMLLGRTALNAVTVKPNERCIQNTLSFDVYAKIKRKKSVKRPLRIAILTREPDNYSTQRLIEAAEKRDHVVELIDTKRCYLNIESHQPEVHYNGQALPFYDAVIPRIGASLTFYGMAIVRQFETMGTFCVNAAKAIGASRDILAAHQILASYHIPMPTTAFGSAPEDTSSLIKLVGGTPTILKLLENTKDRDVILAETPKAATTMIKAFQNLDAHFIAQEFVEEAAHLSLRCFVIGRKVIGSVVRITDNTDPQDNLHSKTQAKKATTTKQERTMALNAAKALGLKIAGVDIIRTKSGPKVLNVSSSPGFEDIETITKKDVAGGVIDFIEHHVTASPPSPLQKK